MIRKYPFDFLVVFLLVFVAVLTTFLLQANFLTSTLLFFGVPSAYLIARRPRNFKKALVAGIIMGLGLGFSFDFVAEFNNAWGWEDSFAFPVQLFGVVSIDVLIWFFFWVFFVVAFYEYFIEHDRSTRISRNAPWVLAFAVFAAIAVVLEWKYNPALLVLPYAYAALGAVTLVIAIVLVLKNPHLFKKVVRLIPFFTFVYLSYEVTALHLGLWTFPGLYLGTVILGTIAFPIEELLLWIIGSSAIVAIYYEFCVDDEK